VLGPTAGSSRQFGAGQAGDDFRPLSGPDPGGPAYGNLLVSRLPLAGVEHLRFPPAGGGEQRTALLGTIQVGSRPVTVAATDLSNRQGHNARQLRELQGLTASRAAPRLLAGDLNMPSTVLLVASRPGWPETGRGPHLAHSTPTKRLDHILRDDPAGVDRPRGARVVAAPVSDHRALWSSSTSRPPDPGPDHQLRRLVLSVHGVIPRVVCAAQVGRPVQPVTRCAI
jgi:hypothetical protein